MFNNLGTAYEQLDQLDEAREAYEAGGKLGSTVAAASRKRLEGVDTIVVAKKDETKLESKTEKQEQVQEFEIVSEPVPEMPIDDVEDTDAGVSEEPVQDEVL